MSQTKDTPNNQKSIASIEKLVSDAIEATLTAGFYGRVNIEWAVKDGAIQQDAVVTIQDNKRLKQM